MRILIVDDEDTVRTTLAANLELEGMAVYEAKSAEQAMALLDQHPVDLVLSDVRMPGVNGVDLFRWIRKARSDLPVVLMTAFAIEALIEDAFREGVFTIVSKPFDIEHLLAILTRAASRPLVLMIDTDGGPGTLNTLRATGLKCSLASLSDAAVRITRERCVDVCVVNLGSAAAEGVPWVERIRAIAPAAAIIGVVPASGVKEARNLAASDTYAYISEPYQSAELIRLIATARGRRAQDAVSTASIGSIGVQPL